MYITYISSTANPRLKFAKSLQRRRVRREQQQVLLEGERLIADSLSAGFPPALFFFTPEAESHHADLLATAAEAGAQLLGVEPALLAEISNTVTPQGMVAVSPIPQITPGAEGLALILDGVRDPGNLGTLLRSAAAAGVDQVILLPGVTDPWSPKVLRAGMGSHFRLAIRHAASAEQLQMMLPNYAFYFADAAAVHHYTQTDWTQPSALILGGETERSGTLERWLGLEAIAIPMTRDVESLNVAVAGSIILFEAARQRRKGA
ncbi:MAG: RNA methyltransferase [Clostridia bacterium]|nr:MAG: RNA methyltransferase [Clostridia bacterium]